MKKSFILHLDSLDILDELNSEQAGELFKAIKNYHNDQPVHLDFALRLAFTPFLKQFERDNVKYIQTVEKNRQNGLKGGRPKKPEKPLGLFKTEAKRINLDSDSVNDSKKGNVDSFNRFWEMYEKKVDKMKCTKLWIKLSEEEKNDIFAKLPIYKNSTPDIKFRKNPTTWLNGKCWLDIEETELKPKKYYPHL
tara:strand:+ start:10330 stop:10908 length:579 start_codon:yes stop_codon:yes gene_type:complete